jgi:hypothetical protein
MARTSPRMGLKIWDDPNDNYDHDQLADNLLKLDFHNHAAGRGEQIPTGGIADGAITDVKLASTAASSLGLSSGGTVRRGKAIIPADETRTNTAYGLMPTPDQVQNVVLPTDGLIFIAYHALWTESVDTAARAAIFIGANQLKVDQSGTAPAVQETSHTSATGPGPYNSLVSTPGGLTTQSATSSLTSTVTTGQAVAYVSGGVNATGGITTVFAAAGPYNVSIQYKASSGSVSARERALWVWTTGF